MDLATVGLELVTKAILAATGDFMASDHPFLAYDDLGANLCC